MQNNITPHLWYDKEAKEAAEFYTSIFPDSKIKDLNQLHGTPSGDVDILTIELMGQEFMMISAGPYFKFTPAISFLVALSSKEEVESLWEKLSKGGSELMPLGEYPFSEKYAWVQDKYGLSWQLMAMGERPITQKIIPTLMYVGDNCGRAEEAIAFYTSVFPDSKTLGLSRYEKGQEPDKEGTLNHGAFSLEGYQLAAMDSARSHDFGFNEAVSLIVNCKDQAEIDHYWEKLSAVPEAEQCGWLKDKFGVSWQVVPVDMNEMMRTKDREKMDRVTQAFLQMKKFDLETLKKAYEG